MKQDIFNKHFFKEILDHATYEVFVTDSDGVVLYINNLCQEFYGVGPEEIIGKNVRDLEDDLFYPSATLQVLKSHQHIELMQKTAKGKRLFVQAKPIFAENGDLLQVINYTRELINTMKLTKQINLLEGQLKEKSKPQQDPSFYKLIAKNEVMKNTVELMMRSARTEKPILIRGETGVGKSLMAQRIHYLSHRNRSPFRQINCANYSETVLDNGEELVQLMNGGTLYLDNIDEMTMEMQSKLLHFIENKRNIPLDGGQINADIRFVSSTKKDLLALVREGKFREDLYYRLNIIPIEIPPLRQRQEDIYPLTMEFLSKFNEEYSRSVSISAYVRNAFYEYEWPGNIRELENLIERLVIVTEGSEVKLSQLPSSVKLGSISKAKTLPEKMAQLEQSLILEAYDIYHSSYKVAESLGISQSAATRKIKKYVKWNEKTHFEE
ncbi:sigma-54 interaction domain-containing protein [Ornithinibacillus sp. 4-3]|uniref:HTH-type transcriptional regulatory protein TyrR n=1 Tax=Ornithinibacillus sp. 4-3 TaxID=3231488 RepID=A0AB39HSL5_9BACI